MMTCGIATLNIIIAIPSIVLLIILHTVCNDMMTLSRVLRIMLYAGDHFFRAWRLVINVINTIAHQCIAVVMIIFMRNTISNIVQTRVITMILFFHMLIIMKANIKHGGASSTVLVIKASLHLIRTGVRADLLMLIMTARHK